jgi:hypothetical protein
MKLPENFLMRGIDPWDDTVFNLVQMKLLLREIASLSMTSAPPERELLTLLADTITEAIQSGGYVRFEGD